MPETQVRLSAGRMNMSREGQAMCFCGGPIQFFAGDKLLHNPDVTWKELQNTIYQLLKAGSLTTAPL
jgi:biotin synthase-like enzyme